MDRSILRAWRTRQLFPRMQLMRFHCGPGCREGDHPGRRWSVYRCAGELPGSPGCWRIRLSEGEQGQEAALWPDLSIPSSQTDKGVRKMSESLINIGELAKPLTTFIENL